MFLELFFLTPYNHSSFSSFSFFLQLKSEKCGVNLYSELPRVCSFSNQFLLLSMSEFAQEISNNSLQNSLRSIRLARKHLGLAADSQLQNYTIPLQLQLYVLGQCPAGIQKKVI